MFCGELLSNLRLRLRLVKIQNVISQGLGKAGWQQSRVIIFFPLEENNLLTLALLTKISNNQQPLNQQSRPKKTLNTEPSQSEGECIQGFFHQTFI